MGMILATAIGGGGVKDLDSEFWEMMNRHVAEEIAVSEKVSNELLRTTGLPTAGLDNSPPEIRELRERHKKEFAEFIKRVREATKTE